MRKDQGFDMLDNADDKTIERLSAVPVLTGREKERILKMSKDKLRRRYRDNNIEEEVSGVEKYSRPKWYSFAALAASFVLVCGIVGTGVLVSRNGAAPDPEKPQLATASSTTATTISTATEKTSATNKSESKTTAIAQADSTETTVSPNETDNNSATLIALFEQLEHLNDICCGKGVNVDSSDNISYEFDGIDYVYYRVTDNRFSTVDEAINYFKETVTGTIWRENFYKCFYDNFSPAIFRESNGNLYFLVENKEVDRITISNFSDPQISNVTDASFDFTLHAELGSNPTLIVGNAVSEDGKWKLSNYQHENTASPAQSNPADLFPSDEPEPQTLEEYFISNCKSEIKNVWIDTYNGSNGSVSIEYTLYDLDGDGSREFFLKYGTYEADYRINAYTYKHGYLEPIGNFPGGHTSFQHDTSTGELVLAWGHMGSGEYDWYKIEDNYIVQTRTESVDYSIIGKENVQGFENVEALPVYGAYALADGSVISFASSNGNYQEVEGLDLSFLK